MYNLEPRICRLSKSPLSQRLRKGPFAASLNHMLRMEENSTQKSVVCRKPEGTRKRRRSKTTWRRTFKAIFF